MKKAPSPSTGLQIPGGPLSEATRLNIGSHLPKSRKYMVHPFVEEPHVKPPHLRHIIKPYLQPTTPTSFDCDKDLTYEKPIRGVKESALKRTVMEGHRVLAGEELHYGKKPKPESPAGVFSGGVEPINLKKKPMVEDPSRLSNILPQQRIYDKFVHGTKNDVLSHNTDTLRRLKGGELLHGNKSMVKDSFGISHVLFEDNRPIDGTKNNASMNHNMDSRRDLLKELSYGQNKRMIPAPEDSIKTHTPHTYSNPMRGGEVRNLKRDSDRIRSIYKQTIKSEAPVNVSVNPFYQSINDKNMKKRMELSNDCITTNDPGKPSRLAKQISDIKALANTPTLNASQQCIAEKPNFPIATTETNIKSSSNELHAGLEVEEHSLVKQNSNIGIAADIKDLALQDKLTYEEPDLPVTTEEKDSKHSVNDTRPGLKEKEFNSNKQEQTTTNFNDSDDDDEWEKPTADDDEDDWIMLDKDSGLNLDDWVKVLKAGDLDTDGEWVTDDEWFWHRFSDNGAHWATYMERNWVMILMLCLDIS